MTFDAFDPRGWLCEDMSSRFEAAISRHIETYADPDAFPQAEGPHGVAAGQRGERAPARRPLAALDKKGNKNTPLGETTAQRGRRLRKTAAKWLRDVPVMLKRKGTVKRKDHAVVTCGSYAGHGLEIAGQRGVMVRKGHSGAFFGQAVTCGSVSACPVCAPKIARMRCDQIRDAVDAHQSQGGAVGLLTLTHGHRLLDALKPQLEAMQKRWAAVKYGEPWKRFCKKFGISGGVSSREVTDGDNGWHPHLHILLFFAAGTTSFQVFHALEWIQAKWAKIARKQGFAISDKAQDFRLATTGKDAGEYLTKHGVEWEMTHAHTKKARGGRSPWQLLDGASPRDRARFVEYALAFHGTRMLTWFGDVRVQEDSDEEAVKQADDVAENVAILPADTYERVVQIGAEDAVLQAAERGGFVAVMETLHFLKCGGCYQPQDGHRLGRANQYPPGWENIYQQSGVEKCLL